MGTPDPDVDPRLQHEFDKLNTVAEQINDFTNQLDALHTIYNTKFQDLTRQIDAARKKAGESALKKNQAYHELKGKCQQALQGMNKALAEYTKARSSLDAAKEMVHNCELQADQLKEDSLCPSVSTAWQETMNHAMMKLNEARRNVSEAESRHSIAAEQYQHCVRDLQQFEKDSRRDISKAKKYCHLTTKLNRFMQEEKLRVEAYEGKVTICKKLYRETLERLEDISNEIHESRGTVLGYQETVGSTENDSLSECGDLGKSDSVDDVQTSSSSPHLEHPHKKRRSRSRRLRPGSIPLISKLQESIRHYSREVNEPISIPMLSFPLSTDGASSSSDLPDSFAIASDIESSPSHSQRIS